MLVRYTVISLGNKLILDRMCRDVTPPLLNYDVEARLVHSGSSICLVTLVDSYIRVGNPSKMAKAMFETRQTICVHDRRATETPMGIFARRVRDTPANE